MQIQCIYIKGDCGNTFCLYMRLLRFDVQLPCDAKNDRNFYECNTQNFLVMGRRWGLSILCSEFSPRITFFRYGSQFWSKEFAKPKYSKNFYHIIRFLPSLIGDSFPKGFTVLFFLIKKTQ